MGAFAGQQPVAGPLSRSRTAFHYADSLGAPMNGSAIASGTLGQIALEVEGSALAGAASGRLPALRASVALRNRR